MMDPMRNTFTDQLEAVRAAVERRDAEDAREQGVTIETLRASRERAFAADANREIRESRIERLGADRRMITPADFERVLSCDASALSGAKAWRIVERFSRSGKAFLVLSGPRGVGKTVACCALKARLGGQIVSADEMTRALRNEHHEALEARKRIVGVSLLIIDDLGLENDEAACVRAFQWAVNERQGPGMRTVVTTNLSKAQIEARYDSRTIERITHNGAIVEVTGESMRGKS